MSYLHPSLTRRRKPISRRSAPLRKTRPRRQRKGRLACLRREANRLWSLVVRKRGACEVCGARERLQGAHGFPKGAYPAVRYLPINGFCLCAGCHKRYTHRPIEWDTYLRNAWGQSVYDELRAKALRRGLVDLETVVSDLRAELEAGA